MPDILSQLYYASYDGIIFPCSEVQEAGSHEAQVLVPLKGSGGFVETTRRNSDVWTVTIPMYSPLKAGPGEDDFTNLFPVRHLELLEAFRKGQGLVFTHQLRGSFFAKAVDWSYTLTAGERNGTTLKVTFVEHVEVQAEIEIQTNAAQTAAIEAAEMAADWEEAFPDDVTDIGDTLNDLETASRDVQAAIEAPGLLADSIGNKIDRVGSAADSVSNSMNAAGSDIANATDYLAGVDKCREGANNAQRKETKPGRETRYWSTKGRTTLPGVARQLKNTLDEIVQLNPKLARSIIIEEGTLVTYYA